MVPQRGFSLLELVVVTCVVALLMTGLLKRLTQLAGAAEQAALQATLTQTQAALNLALYQALLQQQVDALARYQSSNPFALLAVTPRRYEGEKNHCQPLARGSWCFDRSLKQLLYRANFGSPKQNLEPLLRFRVEVKDKPPQLVLQALPVELPPRNSE